MPYSIIIVVGFLLGASAFVGFLALRESAKYNKEIAKQVDEIFSFNIDNDKLYNIKSVDNARNLMTTFQINHFKNNNIPIILQGTVNDIREYEEYISILIEDNTSFHVNCMFNKDINFLNINRGQAVNIKGNLKLDVFIYLEDSQLV